MTRRPLRAQWEICAGHTHACDLSAAQQSPAMRRFAPTCLIWLALLGGVTTLRAAENPIERFGRVEIAPTKTSIYVGSVSMMMPTFIRRANSFESTYVAKVFPFFFSN